MRCQQVPVRLVEALFLLACLGAVARAQTAPHETPAVGIPGLALAAASGETDLEAMSRVELLSPERYLRALSLDLRGRLPSRAEVESVAERGRVSRADIWRLLSDPAFGEQVVAQHRRWWWIALGERPIFRAEARLEGDGVLWRPGVSVALRGDARPCRDEPARFGADGAVFLGRDGAGTREGYLTVSPYWAPETTVRVCALDVLGTLDGVAGCGLDLSGCATPAVERAVAADLVASLERLILRAVTHGGAYTDLVTADTLSVNGRLAFFFARQIGHASVLGGEVSPIFERGGELPEPTETEHWVEVVAGGPRAGILTHPAFLFRADTAEARSARADALLGCDVSVDGSGGDAGEARPSGAGPGVGGGVWEGRLEDRGGFAAEGELLPGPASAWAARTRCGACDSPRGACRADCLAGAAAGAAPGQIGTNLGALGRVRPLATTRARSAEATVIASRPRLSPREWAGAVTRTGRLSRCVTRRTAEWLLHRDLQPGDEPWLARLASRFASRGYQYSALVEDIVTDGRYRRAR